MQPLKAVYFVSSPGDEKLPCKVLFLRITHTVRARRPLAILSYCKLPSLRHETRHSKFYGGVVSCSVYLPFISLGKKERQVRPETPQRCGRLISWLNITGGGGGGGGRRSLSSFPILIGSPVLLYDPPQLATARSSAAAWCPVNDRNPIFHCHRPSTFS